MALLRKVGRVVQPVEPAATCPPEILYMGKDPILPVNFHDCAGLIIWRDSPHIVCVWGCDGCPDGCQDWQPLNRAGWYLKFSGDFPDIVPIGHWAIMGPVNSARCKQPVQHQITELFFFWAMRYAGSAVENPRLPADLSSDDEQLQESLDEIHALSKQ